MNTLMYTFEGQGIVYLDAAFQNVETKFHKNVNCKDILIDVSGGNSESQYVNGTQSGDTVRVWIDIPLGVKIQRWIAKFLKALTPFQSHNSVKITGGNGNTVTQIGGRGSGNKAVIENAEGVTIIQSSGSDTAPEPLTITLRMPKGTQVEYYNGSGANTANTDDASSEPYRKDDLV